MNGTPLVTRFSLLATALRRVAGMPDYEAYVEHLRVAHPDCTIPTEREYYELYLAGRYGSGTTRCC